MLLLLLQELRDVFVLCLPPARPSAGSVPGGLPAAPVSVFGGVGVLVILLFTQVYPDPYHLSLCWFYRNSDYDLSVVLDL